MSCLEAVRPAVRLSVCDSVIEVEVAGDFVTYFGYDYHLFVILLDLVYLMLRTRPILSEIDCSGWY